MRPVAGPGIQETRRHTDNKEGYRAMRKPSTWIAALALFVALGGTAAAANHYLISSTKQISPRVLRFLRGATGPRGATGARGETGPKGETGAKGERGPEGTDARVGGWEALSLGNVQPVPGFEAPAARTEAGGATARLRGVLQVTEQVESTGETVFTIPPCCRPRNKVEIGFNTIESGGNNHVGALVISPDGSVTDDEVPVPVGVRYLLDDVTWNLN